MNRKAGIPGILSVLMLLGFLGGLLFYAEREPGVWITNYDSVVSFVRQSFREHSAVITITFHAKTQHLDEVQKVVDNLTKEALKETDNPREGDYIRYQYGGYEIRYRSEPEEGGFRYITRIIPDYYTYLEEEEWVSDEIVRILESLSLDGKGEYEKVRAIYDYVYGEVGYDDVHKKAEHYHLKTTAYAALRYKTAVCQGFSVLMYRLLREAGLSARVISGIGYRDGGSERHAWNIVGINGLYYNLDVTWDKVLGTEDYFLKSDEDFHDHVRDPEYLSMEFIEDYPMAMESRPSKEGNDSSRQD
ncbi:MAG: hypothetical protein K5989_13085 [Lachnospiraceae bacterium]|nr:hypothetical protein [Lachnospiraceae bacterium]